MLWIHPQFPLSSQGWTVHHLDTRKVGTLQLPHDSQHSPHRRNSAQPGRVHRYGVFVLSA
jgi:hypothetical protein